MTSYAYAYFQTSTALNVFSQMLMDQGKVYEIDPVMGGYCVMWNR